MNSQALNNNNSSQRFNHTTIWLYCFCLGAVSSVFWPLLPNVNTLVFTCAAGVLFIFGSSHWLKSSRLIQSLPQHPPYRLAHNRCFSLVVTALGHSALVSAVFGTLLGTVWAASVGHLHYGWQLPEDKIQKDVMIEGKVLKGGCPLSYNTHTKDDEFQRYTVSLLTLDGLPAARYTPSFTLYDVLYTIKPLKLTLNFRQAWLSTTSTHSNSVSPKPVACLHNGDTFSAIVKLKPAYGTANPNGFNSQQYFVGQGVAANGYIKAILPSSVVHHHSIRQAFQNTLTKLSLTNVRWWQALLLGDRSPLSQDDWQLLQVTGTGHLFSISGMHLSIVAITVFLASAGLVVVLATVWRTVSNKFDTDIAPRQWLTPVRASVFLFVLVVCWMYALISGMALPVIRAYLLLVIGFFISTLNIVVRPLHIMGIMCAGSLLVFPFAQLTASFYLSVGAVIAIVMVNFCYRLNRKPWYVALFQLQLCISIFIIPLTLVWFGNASLIGVLANLVALPAVTLLLPVALFSLLMLHCFPERFTAPFANLFHYLDISLGWLLRGLNGLSKFDTDILSTLFSLPITTAGAINCLLVMCLAMAPYFRGRKRCVFVLMLPVFLAYLPNSDNIWQVHVFDAGQASAIAITQGNEAIIIDSGMSINGKALTASDTVLPFLHSKNIKRIAHVIHTHSDNDHAGGANTILASSLAAGSEEYTPLLGCERGKEVHWKKLALHFLWPKKGNKENSNAQSCVINITDGRHSVLIPGDIERTSEYALVTLSRRSNSQDLRAQLLIAPHHGSNTSSTNAFIDAVQPDAVIYTQGFLNRWGFPSQDIQARYHRRDIRQLSTSYHGYVEATFSFDDDALSDDPQKVLFEIEGYRTTLNKRWYMPPR
mgnify:CR=1 FL=1